MTNQMRAFLITVISIFTLFISCKSQNKETSNAINVELINSIFNKLELQGVDIKQNLLYGFFFYDQDKTKLEKLKDELSLKSYKFVELEKKENGDFLLHVEKSEQNTRQSLLLEEQQLETLSRKYNISSYDGFDIGNSDPNKPLISNESFIKFIAEKKGADLFHLAVKLYNLEINDKAEIVFKKCIDQKVKPDTSAYKLGNILIGENKIEDGISFLEKATNYNPRYLNAYFNLGATCYDAKQFKKSVQYYQEANNIKPNDDRIVYGIAASQFALQQYDRSLEYCKKALQINKHNENAHQLMEMLKGKTQ